MSFEILLVIGLTVALAVALKEYEKLRQELARVRSRTAEIEERAKERGMRLVEKARDKALEIIAQARNVGEADKVDLEERLGRATRRHLDNYRETLQKISKDIENEALRELNEFKDALQMETVKTQDVVAEKISEEYERAKLELNNYKNESLRKIDAQAREMVKEAAKRILGKTLNLEDHEQLVIRALEEVRKKYGF